MLSEKLGRRNLIVNSHVDSLANITSTGDILEVRHFYDQVETHCCALDALDVSSGNYGVLLIPFQMISD